MAKQATMRVRGEVVAVLCVLAGAPSMALAQSLGASRMEADVRVMGSYTENFYYDTPDSGIETSVAGGFIAPRFAYRASSGRADLWLGLDGEYGTFDTPGSLDDYTDGRAAASLNFLATTRTRFELRAGYQHGHDPFGTNRTEDATVRDTELDIWDALTAGGVFHYGAPGARVNAEIGVSTYGKRYKTNRTNTQFLDYDTVTGQYTLFYNYSPKTAALLDFVRIGANFDQSFGPVDDRSGDEYRMRVGTRWLATGKTSGDVRLGYYRRQFDDTTFSDEGFDWQAGIQWAPRARTLFELNTGRATQESYRSDTVVNNVRSGSLSWQQAWTAKTNTTLRVGEFNTRFLGAGRDDRLYNAGLDVNHSFTRYLSLVLQLSTDTRASNDPSSEFDRYSAYLGLRLGR